MAGFGLTFAAAAGDPAAGGETPLSVVATIRPVHGIVAAVMEGVGTPRLLLKGGDSPHTHALRPSEARLLAGARVVFWIGPALEVSLGRTLKDLGGGRAVSLMEADGVSLLPARASTSLGEWEGEDHGDGHGSLPDPHIWLDPANAKAMARTVAAVLSERDPAHRADYESNAARFAGRMDAADARIKTRLEPVAALPFVTFHDALQYYARHFGLRAVASVTPNPERAPGARWVRQLRAMVREQGVTCVFVEPQFEPQLARTIIEGTDARIATLDPLGTDIPTGPMFLDSLLDDVTDSLYACLAGPRPVP
ncbi:MAG: zinc ABC transporter substrate-binding protein [Alphaproteobacteria bacterium]